MTDADPTEAEWGVEPTGTRYVNRELSWLSFNERVLQEAESADVPLFERLKFLAIFSSNLDEFFRVRVASLRTLLSLKKKKANGKKRRLNPTRLLREIREVALAQQERFGATFRSDILPGLSAAGIGLVDEVGLPQEYHSTLEDYFIDQVEPLLKPCYLEESGEETFLKDHTVYLVVELQPDKDIAVGSPGSRLALVEVPSPPLSRFLSIPREGGRSYVVFLDDVIRHNLPRVFPTHVVAGAYAVKVSRDADLHLDDEFDQGLKQSIRKSLKKRHTGIPIRFLYDQRSPHVIVNRLKSHLGLQDEDLILGGRYHNLHDLFGFPAGFAPQYQDVSLPPLPHPALESAADLFSVIAQKDRLLHFPYQSYDYAVRFLEEAASDPDVEAIWISLYRVARDSAVVEALIEASRNGKDVSAFVEVQARFDEELNLDWAERMERAGVRTLYGRQGIKVHAKMALVRRREGDASRYYALLATGNFNEKTARVYSDHGLMTADERLTEEVRRVFRILSAEDVEPDFEHLFVAPFHLRDRFNTLIDTEIEAARAGRPSGITAKMNSLQDRGMIDRLYEASAAGVRVQLVIRGICCLRPGVDDLSANIHGRSIVDRFLEHSRMYLFHRGGDDVLYLASADWMTRNLDRRVEIAFPIYDHDVKAQLLHVLALQLADDTKARIIDGNQSNCLVTAHGEASVRSQIDTYRYLEELLGEVPAR